MMSRLFGILILALTSTSAVAEENIDWNGYVFATHDFRQEGISLSDRDAAGGGGLTVGFGDSGFYAGSSAVILDNQWGNNARLVGYAGYTLDAGDYIYDLAVEYERFVGGNELGIFQIQGSIARDFGLVYLETGADYAPDDGDVYLYSLVEVPFPTVPELTVLGQFGNQLRRDRANIWNWSAGLSYFIGDFELTGKYEDTTLNSREGRGAFIVSGAFYF